MWHPVPPWDSINSKVFSTCGLLTLNPSASKLWGINASSLQATRSVESRAGSKRSPVAAGNSCWHCQKSTEEFPDRRLWSQLVVSLGDLEIDRSDPSLRWPPFCLHAGRPDVRGIKQTLAAVIGERVEHMRLPSFDSTHQNILNFCCFGVCCPPAP